MSHVLADNSEDKRTGDTGKFLTDTEETEEFRGFAFRHQAAKEGAAESLAAALDCGNCKSQRPEMPFLLHEIAKDGNTGVDKETEINGFLGSNFL